MSASDARARAAEPLARAFRAGDEPAILHVLAECHPGTWGRRTVEFWRWRHRQRPGAVEEDIVVIERDGAIVGCIHGAVHEFKLDRHRVVRMSVDGDYAVLPGHRGRNLTDLAHEWGNRALLRRQVPLRSSFARRELNEGFYRKRFGYVYVPSVEVRYTKRLAIERYRRRLAATGRRAVQKPWLRAALHRRSFIVDLEIDGKECFHLTIAPQGFELAEGRAARADLGVCLPRAVANAAERGRWALSRTLLAAVVSGRLRTRGLLRTLPKMAAFAADALARKACATVRRG